MPVHTLVMFFLNSNQCIGHIHTYIQSTTCTHKRVVSLLWWMSYLLTQRRPVLRNRLEQRGRQYSQRMMLYESNKEK